MTFNNSIYKIAIVPSFMNNKFNSNVFKIIYLISTLNFFLFNSCQNIPKDDFKNTLFQNSEVGLFEVDRSKLSSKQSGENCILFGELFDSGELNLLDVYTYSGENAFQRKYYLKNRIYKNPYNSVWVEVIGKYSKLNYDADNKNEIEIYEFNTLPNINKKIALAKVYCNEWMRVNKNHFDLNNYKKTQRFKSSLFDLDHLDFNETKFESNDSLIFFYYNKMIVGIDCGKHTLRENEQRGDFLNYLAIYDLENEKLIKVKIVNTGYFLE